MICVSSLIAAQMCGKYHFNKLTVGQPSNLTHSLEPATASAVVQCCCSDSQGKPGCQPGATKTLRHPPKHDAPCCPCIFFYFRDHQHLEGHSCKQRLEVLRNRTHPIPAKTEGLALSSPPLSPEIQTPGGTLFRLSGGQML